MPTGEWTVLHRRAAAPPSRHGLTTFSTDQQTAPKYPPLVTEGQLMDISDDPAERVTELEAEVTRLRRALALVAVGVQCVLMGLSEAPEMLPAPHPR